MLAFTPLSSAPISSFGDRIVEATAAIVGRATVTSSAGEILGSASILGSANLVANAIRNRTATASVTSPATVTALGYRMLPANAVITSSGTIAAYAVVNKQEINDFFSRALVSCTAKVSQFATCSIASNADVSAIGYIIGEEWVKVQPESDIWLKQG